MVHIVQKVDYCAFLINSIDLRFLNCHEIYVIVGKLNSFGIDLYNGIKTNMYHSFITVIASP